MSRLPEELITQIKQNVDLVQLIQSQGYQLKKNGKDYLLSCNSTSAISIARNYMGRKKNFAGQSFWARGYHVSTVGRDEQVIREYIKHQEKEDQRIEQLNFF